MKKIILIVASILTLSLKSQEECVCNNWFSLKKKDIKQLIVNIKDDTFDFGKELCSERSLKVLTSFVPLYLLSRPVDHKIYSYFYDPATHTNKHQIFHNVGPLFDYQISEIPAIVYRLMAILHPNPEERRSALVFTTGLLWTYLAKITIKKIASSLKLDATIRPLHPGFNRNWLNYSGLPSGHMSVLSFSATYLSLHKGPKYGIPLWMYAGSVLAARVVGNHHFLSQTIFGTGLGVMFGYTSYAVFKNISLFPQCECGFALNDLGQPGISLAYNF